MKWLKYALLVVAIVLVIAMVMAALGTYYLKQTPDFYRPYRWTVTERAQLNQRTVDKFGLAHNLAARLWAEQRAASRRGQPTTTSVAPLTLTFTQEELNASLFHNAETFGSFRKTYEQFITEPGIYIKDGQLFLAGRVKGMAESVVSAAIQARVDDGGQLYLALGPCAAGRLPIPKSFIYSRLEPAAQHLRSHETTWADSATIDSGGGVNASGLSLAGARIFLAALGGRPVPPLIPVPATEKGVCYPLKLTELKIEEESITLTLTPTDPAAQQAYFKWLVEK